MIALAILAAWCAISCAFGLILGPMLAGRFPAETYTNSDLPVSGVLHV